MRARPTHVALALALVLTVCAFSASTALGFWTGAAGSVPGTGAAATVGGGSTPSVQASAGDVVVEWTSSSLSNDAPVDGYVVKRHRAVDGVAETVGAGCSGTITGLTCTELQVPAGRWRYTVTPVFATHWRGADSPESAVVTIGPPPIDLGGAESFAVLAGSTATSGGVSTLSGDLGISPGTAATGFPPGELTGTFHSNDGVAVQAQADLRTAYDTAVARAPATPMAGDLGGLTLPPGTYAFGASIALASGLTLDAEGDPNAVWVFQAGSTLITAAGSHVDLINGASACNVFWQVGSSATLGASSALAGTIMALTSISMGDAVTVDGRALAHNGAVTMINDAVTVPPACGGGATPPSDDAARASRDAAPPSDDAAPATDDATPPNHDATPSNDDATPASEDAPASTGGAAPAEDEAPSANPDVIAEADSEPPTSVFRITDPVGASFDPAGPTLFYKGDAPGSFSFVGTVSDAGSGPASVAFPAIETAGWVHDAETVSTPDGGPFASTPFAWSTAPANPKNKTLSVSDAAGNIAGLSVAFVSDTTPPVGGAIDSADGVVDTLAVPVTTTPATDAASGVSTTTTIRRDVAPLLAPTATCGPFPGTFDTTIILDAGVDTSVADGHCYRYEYVVLDNVGNEVTFTSAGTAEVDASGEP